MIFRKKKNCHPCELSGGFLKSWIIELTIRIQRKDCPASSGQFFVFENSLKGLENSVYRRQFSGHMFVQSIQVR